MRAEGLGEIPGLVLPGRPGGARHILGPKAPKEKGGHPIRVAALYRIRRFLNLS